MSSKSAYQIEMLCNVCWRILRGKLGDVYFSQHDSVKEVKASHDTVVYAGYYLKGYKLDDIEDIDRHTEVGPYTSAPCCCHNSEGEDVFRPDFKLESGSPAEAIGGRTFVLQQTGEGITDP